MLNKITVQRLNNLLTFPIFDNWRIGTQILVISLLIWLLLFFIFLGIIYIAQNYLFYMLINFSYEIFLKQTLNQQYQSYIYEKSVHFTLQHTAVQLQAIQSLFINCDFYKGQGYFNVSSKPQFCLNNKEDNDKYCFNSTFSCGIFSQSKNYDLPISTESIQMCTHIFTSFKITFDNSNSSPIYYFNNDKIAQFYCLSNGIVFPSTFQPLTRQYYLEHLNKQKNSSNLKEIYIESPYQIATNKIRIPMTTNMLSGMNEIIGIIAHDIDIDRTSVLKNKEKKLQIIIFDEYGKVLVSEHYNNVNQSIYYIYDQNISGFSQDDYQQVKNQLAQMKFESNCQNLQTDNILCRYNSFYEDNLIIETRNISHTNFYLMLLSKTNKICQEEQYNLKIQKEKIDTELISTIRINIFTPVCVMLVSQLILNFIIKEILNLNADIQNTLFDNKMNSQMVDSLLRKKSFLVSETISDFSRAINHIFQQNFGSKKSEVCYELEKTQYPLFQRIQIGYSKQLKYTVQKLISENVPTALNQRLNINYFISQQQRTKSNKMTK